MSEAAAAAPAAPSANAPGAQPGAQPNPQAQPGAPGAPPVVAPKTRPESPLTYDEALGKWVSKTKVDGKESVVPWDDLHRDAQLVRSSQERFEEAKAIKLRNGELTRLALSYQEALKNPQRAYETWAAMGLDPNAMLEQLYAHADAESKLTTEQKELRAYKERERAEQERLRQREADEAQRAEDERQTEADARVERAFGSHMTKLGVPDDPMLRGHLSHILWAMHDRASQQNKTVPISEAVPEAISSMKSMTKAVVGMMSPEERVAFLGPEIIEELIAARLAGAAHIPAATTHHSQQQSRHADGKFSPHTVVRPGTNFYR